MNRVCILTAHGWVGISSPVINSALYLAELQYEVDLYVEQNAFCEELGIANPMINNPSINLIYYRANNNLGSFLEIQEDSVLSIYKEDKDYEFIIGFEPLGLIRASLLAKKTNTLYVYFSLELYEKEDEIKKYERLFNKEAVLTISQDNQRVKALCKLNEISIDKATSIWNSSIEEECIYEKKDYFRKKFSIPEGKKIVLCIGTLLPEHGVDKLLKVFESWDDDFVLVLHGWIPNKVFEEEISKIADTSKRLFVSTDMLPFQEKYLIYQSVDIGFIYYEPTCDNMKYAAGSSGKLYDFMRVGVPSVGNNIPGMKHFLNDNNIGFVFNDFNDINTLLKTITENYEYYSQNSYKAYENYNFKKSFEKAFQKLL